MTLPIWWKENDPLILINIKGKQLTTWVKPQRAWRQKPFFKIFSEYWLDILKMSCVDRYLKYYALHVIMLVSVRCNKVFWKSTSFQESLIYLLWLTKDDFNLIYLLPYQGNIVFFDCINVILIYESKSRRRIYKKCCFR